MSIQKDGNEGHRCEQGQRRKTGKTLLAHNYQKNFISEQQVNTSGLVSGGVRQYHSGGLAQSHAGTG